MKVKNLSKLIENLKIITENINENNGVVLEDIKIINLINNISKEYTEEFLEKKIRIKKTTRSLDEFKIKCDKELNKAIFRNIFSNIQKYALEDSEVSIDIIKENSCLIIKIKNISKEKIIIGSEEIMKRFKRGDKSRHTEGLGLDIVKKFVQLQNGIFSIEVEENKFESEIKYLI